MLQEADLPFEPVRIDEHSKAISTGGDYRSVDPLGYVPALVLVDGTLLTEGATIVQYIADLVPEKNLHLRMAQSSQMQAWLSFCAGEMHKGVSPLFYKGIGEEGRDVFRGRLRTRFSHIDTHLS